MLFVCCCVVVSSSSPFSAGGKLRHETTRLPRIARSQIKSTFFRTVPRLEERNRQLLDIFNSGHARQRLLFVFYSSTHIYQHITFDVTFLYSFSVTIFGR